MKYVAYFSRTSNTTAKLLLKSVDGYTTKQKEGIVSFPELLVDQRGLELSLLCSEIGASISDVIDVVGIENQHERDWVIYQAHHWRGHLRKCLTEYERSKQEYLDSKARV